MTPHEARDQLVNTIHDTAALMDVKGWNEDGAPSVGSCDDGAGVNWGYGYGAPQQDRDLLADAEVVADYWTSLGMSVRTNTDHEPAVFATGGPVQGLRLATGPGDYYIVGTSLCVPGDANQTIDEEYVG